MTFPAEILTAMGDIADKAIIDEFVAQGHHLTGSWEESMKSIVSDDEIIGVAKSYGAIVDAGVQPSNIPFGNGNNTGAKVSSYIQGLFEFWKLRKPGISDKMALQLAFATAKTQKKEGMSTIGSRAYSKTGDRQQFVKDAFQKKQDEIDAVFNERSVEIIDDLISEPLQIIS